MRVCNEMIYSRNTIGKSAAIGRKREPVTVYAYIERKKISRKNGGQRQVMEYTYTKIVAITT